MDKGTTLLRAWGLDVCQSVSFVNTFIVQRNTKKKVFSKKYFDCIIYLF